MEQHVLCEVVWEPAALGEALHFFWRRESHNYLDRVVHVFLWNQLSMLIEMHSLQEGRISIMEGEKTEIKGECDVIED